jgi:hypothetical protein
MTFTIDFPAVIGGLALVIFVSAFVGMIYHLIRFSIANNRTCQERHMMLDLCSLMHKYDKELGGKLDAEYRAVDYDEHLNYLRKYGTAAGLYPLHTSIMRKIFK